MAERTLDRDNRSELGELTGEPYGTASLVRRLFSEFLGTLLLVAVGTGAATILTLGPLRQLALIDPRLLGDPIQQGLLNALLGFTAGDVLTVALAFATILAVLVYALGGVSGAHFNPAVTFALAVGRHFSWRQVPAYWIVQCLGGIAGAYVVAGIYGDAGASLNGNDVFFGATVVRNGVDQYQAILAEAFVGFVLMTAIMAVAVDPRAPKGWSGLIIGLALGGGILVTAAQTGGSGNFARSLGPFVASLTFETAGDVPWKDLIVYGVGPLIGAAAAALVYESVTGLQRTPPPPAADEFGSADRPSPRPGAATSATPSGSTAGTSPGASSPTTPAGPPPTPGSATSPPGGSPTTPPTGGLYRE
ncbi:MAG TPA: aquaporin [Actinomycetota bacterium]|nr:aquaporin [Actinomycetota bacterium]